MHTRLLVQSGLNDGLGSSIDRRHLLKLIAGTGAAAVAGAVVLPGAAGAQTTESISSHYRTTTALNLRANPSTSAKILLVMPANAIVEYLGETKSGFRKVAYQGTGGWAYADYLTVSNGGSDDPPVIIGQGVTTTAVNFRSGPSTGHSIHRVLPKGTTIDISDTELYGFRFVKHNGQGGWLWDEYIAPAGGEGPAVFVTTAAVNLRAKPNTSAKILMVIPAGQTVLDYDLVMSNGYRGVDYKGNVGWVYDAYLK